MPSKPSSDVFGSCASRAKYVTQYARRIESRCKSVADRNQVFSGAYVSYLAFFESQIEELFVGLICGKYTHPDSMVKPLVLMPDKTTAKLIVTGGRSYVDWLPYDAHTRKRASSFLADGAPFKGLSNPSRKVLGKSFIIRNALAHSSEHSQRRFKEELINDRSIPRLQQTPPAYLRGDHNLKDNRLEMHFGELLIVMQQLTT